MCACNFLCVLVSVQKSESIQWTNERNNYKYYKANQYNCVHAELNWIEYQLWRRAHSHPCGIRKQMSLRICNMITAISIILNLMHQSSFLPSLFWCIDRCLFRSIELQCCRFYHHHKFLITPIRLLRFCCSAFSFITLFLLLLNSAKRKEISSSL